ncbi:MAG: M23 family metallopeptidase, partial [Deltaproteobacteria bacterium]|nr:M23 family metallopeptidase [Deltaproteobacteria bacterium]
PDEIWAGEPFLARIQAPGLAEALVSWRGKTISAKPGSGDQPEEAVLFLLAVPQKEEASSLALVLTLIGKDKGRETLRVSLPVRRRAYPEQRLSVAKKYVQLTPAQLARVKKDQQEVRATLAGVSPVRHWRLPLLRPVPGKITSVYGLRRFFNGEERSPHRGIDFAAAKGDAVPACADGLVALVSEHYFGGNTVILDHGLGVFSLYLHLSEFAVSQGQFVRRGQSVGAVGDTGRVTGPHLHFSLAVQGDLVDAAPCLEGLGNISETEAPAGSGTEPGSGAPEKTDRPVAGKGGDL